jgi:hypothetical protein
VSACVVASCSCERRSCSADAMLSSVDPVDPLRSLLSLSDTSAAACPASAAAAALDDAPASVPAAAADAPAAAAPVILTAATIVPAGCMFAAVLGFSRIVGSESLAQSKPNQPLKHLQKPR